LQRWPLWLELVGDEQDPPCRSASMAGARASARARHERRKRRHKTVASHIKAARVASSSGGGGDRRGSSGGGDSWRLGGPYSPRGRRSLGTNRRPRPRLRPASPRALPPWLTGSCPWLAWLGCAPGRLAGPLGWPGCWAVSCSHGPNLHRLMPRKLLFLCYFSFSAVVQLISLCFS
jgi:hypothetical protein